MVLEALDLFAARAESHVRLEPVALEAPFLLLELLAAHAKPRARKEAKARDWDLAFALLASARDQRLSYFVAIITLHAHAYRL